jgi:D-arabinose 1-dehydrogenase-like Zn-dependent alcohol dehydrogenase
MGRIKELGLRPVEGVRDGRRLARLLSLAAEGRISATVRQIYPIDKIVEAHRALDTGHGRGKIVIAID